MKRFFYDHGLPFSEKLAENVDDAMNRVLRTKKASMIIIDGGVGEGKTTLAVHVSDYVNGAYTKLGTSYKVDRSKFTVWDKQIGLGGELFVEKMRLAGENNVHVIIYDESGDFNRRGSLTKFNQMLNQVFETYRAMKVLVILCLPSFHVLDQDLIDKKIPRLLLHLSGRNEFDGDFQGYSTYRMTYVLHYMKKMVVKSFAYDTVEDNFRGHFLDLEPERMQSLENYSMIGKRAILEKAEIKFQGLVSRDDVAKKFNRSLQWVNYRFWKARIKPVKYIGKRAFYSSDVIDTLSEPVKN